MFVKKYFERIPHIILVFMLIWILLMVKKELPNLSLTLLTNIGWKRSKSFTAAIVINKCLYLHVTHNSTNWILM